MGHNSREREKCVGSLYLIKEEEEEEREEEYGR